MTNAQRRVREVMQTEVVTVSVDDQLDLADDIMRLGRVRHMPVLEGERLVGIVSNRDLLAASLTKSLEFEPKHRRAFLRSVSVSEAMTTAPLTVAPDATLSEVARILCREQIGCLPVVEEDGSLVGLVTETDLMRVAYLDAEEQGATVDVADGPGGLEGELRRLETVRDELRVQLHLAQADARDLWHELEDKWRDVERKVSRVAREAEGPLEDVKNAAEGLLGEIREGYRRIRESLER